MKNYRKSSHTVYDIKYHIVWITKYRKPILDRGIGERARDLIREICTTNDSEIIKGHVAKDHIHIFVSVPPHLSVSKLVQSIKGKTSRKLMMEYKNLSNVYWGRHMWARGYFVASSGNITDEVIKEYISLQSQEPTGKDFTVSD